MKKNFIYALMSAIALTGLMGLTACSDKEVGEVNPNYNPETKEVTADFVFNISTGNTATTRMSEANTQATLSQAFRGIDNAMLLSFKLGTSNDGKNVAANTSLADKQFSLGSLMSAGAIDPDGGGSSVPQSRRVIELALPTETNCLMFWGKAVKTGDDYLQGKTDWTMSKTLADQAFSLVRVVPDDASAAAGDKLTHGQTALLQYENLIAAIMTKIIQTSVDYDVTYDGTQHTGTLAWSDFVEEDASGKLKTKTADPLDATANMNSLGEILGNAYVTFNTIGDNELRAGSGKAVARMIGDLYSVIIKVADATATSKEEAITKEVGAEIIENIEAFFTNLSTLCVFKNITTGTIKTSMLTDAGVQTDDANLVTEDLNNFPINFNLPAGSTILTLFKDTNSKLAYAYMGSVPTYAMGGSSSSTTTNFDPKNYMYPPELCYFGNSPIRVTNDTHVTADYPDGTSNWAADASWAAGATGTNSVAWTKDGHVLSSTRSVAMQNNINYGTSLLKTTIRYNTENLEDNNHNIQNARTGANEANATIDVTKAGQFTLTGILIGGQEQTMGWNYLAKAGTAAKYECMVYDRDLPSTAIPAFDSNNPTTTSTPCYTTVWDNWDETLKNSKQRDVYIALEFTNNTGKDFWGMNNLIRNGGVFYITAKLDPDANLNTSDRSDGITWPSTASATTTLPPHALPPYDTDGNTIKQRRVFIQDYMTTANFVIGRNSLQYALVAVPDLRSAQISLGLSVDLEWSTGLTFNNVIVGGDTGYTNP